MARNIKLALHYAAQQILSITLPKHLIKRMEARQDPYNMSTHFWYWVVVPRRLIVPYNHAQNTLKQVEKIQDTIIKDAETIQKQQGILVEIELEPEEIIIECSL